MKWYNDMTEQQKQNFKKVITIFVVGAILILLIPMVMKWILYKIMYIIKNNQFRKLEKYLHFRNMQITHLNMLY